MSVRISDTNNVPKLLREIMELDGKKLEVGVFGEDDDFMVMIARVNEFGMTIKPKRAKALAIPLPAAGDRQPSDFGDELFVLDKNNDGNALLVRKKGENDVEPLFVLMKSVTIPERAFIRGGFDQNKQKIEQKFRFLVGTLMDGQMTSEEVLDVLGLEASSLVKRYMTRLKEPKNSKLTIDNKRSNNPLIDNGHLRDVVTWKVRNT